ncbi:MAG TPA: hypothetical protein VH092_20670, partial [Urbifossiella sp.]|nr:hypothetical protein [Urbifossiella sp.]
AQSQSFNLLIRALRTQGRIEILSRPQLQVTDNQTGFVQVGQDFPIPTGLVVNGLTTTQGIDYRPTGVTLRVTPRVNPDGKVLMRVEPQIASPAAAPIAVGTSGTAFPFNVQTIQTTILAGDGETVVLGGLITNQDTRTQNGIPFLQDIPYVGSLFRYRVHSVARREILIIMTPYLVRNEFDQARMLADESRRMEWCLPDVAKIHGSGMEVMGPARNGANPQPIPGYTNPGGMIPGGFQFGPTRPWMPPENWTPPGGPAVAPGGVPPGFVPPPGPAFIPAPTPLPAPQPQPGFPAPPADAMGAAAPTFVPAGPYTPAGTVAPVAASAPAAPAAAPRGPGYVMVQPQPPAPPAPPAAVPVPGRGFAMTPTPPAAPAVPAAAAPAQPAATNRIIPAAMEGQTWNIYGR